MRRDFSSLRVRRGLGIALALLSVLSLPSSPAGARAVAERADTSGAGCEARTQLTGATPVGVGPCDGVRPGGFHRPRRSGGCTWNFLFRGSDGHRYMGTAGHCLVRRGEKVWSQDSGPRVKGLIDGDERPVGRAVYAVNDDRRDFGLVRLDEGVPASPKMCHFGGPDSGPTDPPAGTLLHHYGNGLLLGDTVPARTSVATGVFDDPLVLYAAGAAIFGDSGSAVITEEGHAVGVLVHLSVPRGQGIARLEPHLVRAEARLGLDLRLQTAPLE